MTVPVRYLPPTIVFEEGMADALTALAPITPDTYPGMLGIPSSRPSSPFVGYTRTLTSEGGVLIAYKDLDCRVRYTILRIYTWTVVNGLGAWGVFQHSGLSTLKGGACLIVLGILTWLIVRMKIEAQHTVEIRPHCMVVDGTDVFRADDIGDNWPELKAKDDAPDQATICGICGTRFIEYMTVNRLDENDRTPEVLQADLKNAMEQLWGRREVTFAATP